MERGESSTARAAGPPQPWIFLSHSGWQKDFVTHLYRELLHVHHHPFFDMDPIRSLPPGLDYSLRIFQACHGCKLGVVVLSHEYMESLWPMLELQHLLLYNRDRPVYPLFYQLEPADLIKEKNLERWKQSWSEKAPRWQTRMQELQEMMGGEVQINLDTTFWPEMLKMLQYRSGQVRKVIHASNERTQYQSEYDYVHAIVSNICSLLPPPRPYLLDGAIKGHERMMEEVASLFDQQAGSIVVGMHGIGGSGKSTLCKAMANYYSQHFSGRSWWLELPSNATENAILVNRIKDLLPYMSFGQDTVNRVSTLDQVRACSREAFSYLLFLRLMLAHTWA
ncbi:hypothetical protein L7F22_025363 [Adiantum nelumboides]|nr:hypothetical protein [Adiantum nelumboides]